MQTELIRPRKMMSRRDRGVPVLGSGGSSGIIQPSAAPGYFDDFDADTTWTASAWTSTVGSTVVTQAVALKQPTRLLADINGHAAINFNQQSMASTTWGMNGSADWTCYAVMALTGVSPDIGDCIIGSGDAGSNRATLRLDNQGGADNGQYRFERTGANAFPANGTTYPVDMRPGGAGQGYHLVGFKARATGQNDLYVDGVKRGTTFTNAGPFAFAFLNVGNYVAAVLYANMKLTRWMNYNAAHDDTTSDGLWAYLRQRYALS